MVHSFWLLSFIQNREVCGIYSEVTLNSSQSTRITWCKKSLRPSLLISNKQTPRQRKKETNKQTEKHQDKERNKQTERNRKTRLQLRLTWDLPCVI